MIFGLENQENNSKENFLVIELKDKKNLALIIN